MLVALVAIQAASCSGSEEETGVESDASVAVAMTATAPAAPSADTSPPEFDGVARVELLGFGTYRVSWEPGRDGESLAGMLAYQVLHVAEPWREPVDADVPVAASLTGAQMVELELDASAGRFFVRAVDGAGNRSAWGPGLEQRSRRPWMRAPDGGPLAEIRECASFDAGRGVCVGANGFVARWDRERWAPIPASDGADLRLVTTSAELHVFSPAGHLYRLNEAGALESFSIRFEGAEPALPLAQFTRDHLGLAYWLDAAGTLMIGPGEHFRPMGFVLGLPDQTECGRLRGLGYSAAALFAFCETGSVYSVRTDQTELMWLPLTSQTPFSDEVKVHGVIANDDAGAIVHSSDGVRRVGVGGWSDMVVVGRALAGAGSPIPGRVGRPEIIAGQTYIPTDLGLTTSDGTSWRILPGSEGDAVGVFAPSPLEPADQLSVVYSDGSVARLRGSRRSWVVEPPLSGFALAGHSADGGVLAVARGEHQGVWALEAGRWRQLTNTLPSPVTGLFVGTTIAGHLGSGTLYFGGTLDEVGVIYEYAAGRWVAGTTLYPPPAPAVATNAPAVGRNFGDEELAAPVAIPELSGVSAAALPVPPGLMARIVAIDVAADGRAVAITEREVWWRTRSGWLLISEQVDGNLHNVAIDAGESYVLVQGTRAARCWRDLCDLGVAGALQTPSDIVASWRDTAGLVVLSSQGQTTRFIRGQLADGTRMPASNADTPPGRWEPVGTTSVPVDGSQALQVLLGDGIEVVWTRSGSVLEVVEGGWLRQAHADDGLLLIENERDWALLTSRGLLRLGDVATATRELPGGQP